MVRSEIGKKGREGGRKGGREGGRELCFDNALWGMKEIVCLLSYLFQVIKFCFSFIF